MELNSTLESYHLGRGGAVTQRLLNTRARPWGPPPAAEPRRDHAPPVIGIAGVRMDSGKSTSLHAESSLEPTTETVARISSPVAPQ